MRPILRHPFVEEVLPVDPPQTGNKRPAQGLTPVDLEQLRKDLAACDGGTGIYAKAKAANGGKDPVFLSGDSVMKTGGNTFLATGEIILDPGQSRPDAVGTAIFELTNLSNKARFSQVTTDAAAGKLSREEYTRANEAIEYEAGINELIAARACARQWGAPPGWKSGLDYLTKAKDFEDFYEHYLHASHKAYYQGGWDKSYATAFRDAHP